MACACSLYGAEASRSLVANERCEVRRVRVTGSRRRRLIAKAESLAACRRAQERKRPLTGRHHARADPSSVARGVSYSDTRNRCARDLRWSNRRGEVAVRTVIRPLDRMRAQSEASGALSLAKRYSRVQGLP